MNSRRRRDEEIQRELRAHLDLEAEAQQEEGVTPDEARYAARRALGNELLIQEDTRAMWGWTALETFSQDLRFAFRGLRKNPGFALSAVLVLALGVGANATLLSVVNAVLLRPLPFHDPERVLLVWEKIPQRGIDRVNLCAANFLDIQQRNRSFATMATMVGSSFAITGDGSPEQVPGAMVSSSFFPVLGVMPERGRGLQPEDENSGDTGVVVLSQGLWQRRFGGNPGIIGRSIQLNGRAHEVVGIMPRGFQALFRDHELWTAMQLTAAERGDRRSHFLMALGRLKPGITQQQAQAELDTIGGTLESEYPEANAGRGLRVAPVRDELVGDTRHALLLLMGGVGLVLLVACINVANLLLARAMLRRKEIAVRLALGAGRRRLLQQLLTEGFLLAMLGVIAGLAISFWTLRSLPLLIPSTLSLPGLDRVGIDGPVLAVAATIAMFVSVIFGCTPAWQLFRSARGALGEKSPAAQMGSGKFRLRSTLLSFEVAFSLVLLLGAGLLLRSFSNLMQVEPGFRADGVLTVQFQMPENQTARQQAELFRQVHEQLQSVPGVESVAAVEYLPLSGSGVSRRMAVVGRPQSKPGEEPSVLRHIVTPDYFRAMRVPLQSGRSFRDADMNAEPLVAVINETMARRYWANENPVGQYLKLGVQGKVASAPPRMIVGVVADVRHGGLRTDPKDEVYLPLGQEGWPSIQLVIRSQTVDPASLTPDVKRAVWAVDKNQPLPRIRPMTHVVSDSVWQPRLNTLVLTVFAALVLALALSGIYGLVTQVVGSRTPEIGIRMALGARPASVLLMILRQGFAPVLIGAIGGLGLAVLAGKYVAAQLYGIKPADPLTFAGGVLLVLTAALLAMVYPAWRAARMDPMTALRHE